MISLLDRWFNPVDVTAGTFAMYHLVIPGDGLLSAETRLTPGTWHTLTFQWDGTTDATDHRCRLLVDGTVSGVNLPLQHRAPNGLSYVHFISNADSTDLEGITLRGVRATITP